MSSFVVTTASASNASSFPVVDGNSKADLIIVLSGQLFYQQFNGTHRLANVLGLSNQEITTLTTHVFPNKLKESSESVSHVDHDQLLNEAPYQRKYVFGVLPNKTSRHNTPSRAQAITSFIKSTRGSAKHVLIVLFPVQQTYALAQTCAVARAFSTFTRKTSGSGITEHYHIHVEEALQVEDATHNNASFVQEATNAIESIRLVQRLVDSPPNILHTANYRDEILAAIQSLNSPLVKVHTHLEGVDLEKAGFNGIYNVGKGSSYPPVFLAVTYTPLGAEGVPPIALVGKGIVYDTGGLSIKGSTGMPGMKDDMAGSAAVLGAFQVCVRNQVSTPVAALFCIAENSVDGVSFRNDDIITMLSGKTVEVNNTDAEGRLVLADGCYFAASTLKAAVIIDIATLTGAQSISVGQNHSGVYCNDEALESVAIDVGKRTGELVFPFPYVPEFFKNEFRSTVADMKNSVACRTNAQSACAGQFIGNHIESFLQEGGRWLHVDMAAPAMNGDRATGYGVLLLSTIVGTLAVQQPISK